MPLYMDGIEIVHLRFATQPYSTASGQLHNKFMHLTNFAINKNGDFIYNNDPSERCGHKWRMRSLWRHLKEWGLPVEEFGRIWARIKDLVVKSILSGLSEMREEFKRGNETRLGRCYWVELSVLCFCN